MALVGGAHLLVHSATYFARVMGISELVIGLTVIAVGTSIPELATSMVAAIRKESDISVGNVLGSNIFNILAVLGIAAIIQPLRVNSASLRVDMPVMLFFSIFLIPHNHLEIRPYPWARGAFIDWIWSLYILAVQIIS